MSKDQIKARMYTITAACKKAIKAQQLQGFGQISCSATLSKRGKRLNSIDRAAHENFSKLLLDYVASEDPDKLRVELRGAQDELLWSKTFNLESDAPLAGAPAQEFKGLGEIEITEMVHAKLQEIRRHEELEELRALRDQLEDENEALHKQLGELEEVVAAKKNIEYYSNIIGLALPGLAKMLNKTALGGTLGMLAGMDTEVQTESPDKDQRDTIIDLANEFMRELDDAQLGQLYLVFIELSNNPALISQLLSHLSSK